MTRAVALVPPKLPDDVREAVIENLELLWAVEDSGEQVDESWAEVLANASVELGEVRDGDRERLRELIVLGWRRGVEFGVPRSARVHYTPDNRRPFVLASLTSIGERYS